jgi:ankyrin repeat protein
LQACFNDDVSLVGGLLEHGASVWVTDNKSQSCLHAYAATGADQPGVALLLIRAAESGDAFARHENPSAVFVNGLDDEGNTAMHLATARKGVKTLLENGADLTVLNKCGRTPLFNVGLHDDPNYTVGYFTQLFLDINDVNGLIEHLDHQDNEGNTCLHAAVACADEQASVAMVKAGCSPHIK